MMTHTLLNNTRKRSSVDLDIFLATEPPPRPSPPPLPWQDDALARSWASYGVWLRRRQRWISLNDVEPAPHDYDMAEVTRRFYRDQLAFQALRGQELSEFRRTLYEVCSQAVTLTSEHLGLLHRLPYFYIEDTQRQGLRKTFQGHQPKFYDTIGPTVTNAPRSLRARQRIEVSRKRQETLEFWWSDDHNHPVLWWITANNPMVTLLEGLWSKGHVDVTANWWVRRDRYNDMTYWTLSQPVLGHEVTA